MQNLKPTLGIAGPVELSGLLDYLQLKDSELKYFPRGMGGTTVVNLVRALLARGNRLILFTLDTSVEKEVILQGENLKICIGPYRKRARSRALDLFKVERNYLTQAILREKPELIHAHWTYEFAWGALDSGIAHLITAHDVPLKVLKFNPTIYRMIRAVMAFIVLHRTQNLSAVSPYLIECLKGFARKGTKFHVVPNSMPEEIFNINLSSRRDIPITFATILNGLKGHKNGYKALLAFTKVRELIPEARLIMYGDNFEEGEVAELWAKKKGLDRNVAFAGNLPNKTLMERLVKEVSVLVHPSLEETFGMCVAEAMALGIPVIGGMNSGAVSWTMENDKGGVLVNVKSIRSLAEAMTNLAKNHVLRIKLGEYAQESARRRFHPNIVAAQYVRIYNSILGGSIFNE